MKTSQASLTPVVRLTLLLTVGLALLAGRGSAQNVTGSLSGTVNDSSGQAIVSAEVVVTNPATAQEVKTVTDERGDFVINALRPGTYRLQVTMAGFRQYQQTGLVLTAGERRAVNTITLEIGTITEQISVTATAASVQTVSAERSGLITNRQVTDLMLIGRDYLGLMQTLPGVVDLSSHESPAGGGFNMAIQGNRPGTNNLTIDGATNLNSGSSTGNVDFARSGFCRRSESAPEQLPGRVRAQLRDLGECHHQGRN